MGSGVRETGSDPGRAGHRRRDAALAMLSLAGRSGAGAAARRVRTLFSPHGQGFTDLAVTQAASTAGDTLVALGLAGTLFFSVPTAEARGNVALYLLLTVAPFAVLGPALSAVLERRPLAYRLSLVVSAAARAVVVALLVWRMDTLWLFPAAFALLVLSRLYIISRNAVLPQALDSPHALVAANARLAWIGVIGGAAAALPGAAGLALWGPVAPLLLAGVAFGAAAVVGRRLPGPDTSVARPTVVRSPDRSRRHVRGHLPRSVRLAQLATAGVRLLNGFLLLLLAFAFRNADAQPYDFAAVLVAAGAGFGLAALLAPRLERRLREEPMVVAALALEAAAAFIAGQWFGVPAAAALAMAAGFAWGTAKLAFDGLLQSAVGAKGRGAAFTRSETVFALAWVAGALVPTGIPMPTSVGLVSAGLAALAAQVVYVAHLLLAPRPPGSPSSD